MNPALDRDDFQLLESCEADFGMMTWTFTITAGNEVGAGAYAVMPSETFMKMRKRLELATHLIRHICETQNESTMGARGYESCQAFFDPEPLI